ncbi:hypothetical protein NQZ68_021756 [Dissostichus eleginoides]|nr:hypothetical protein NQZ68_021756 [Dissostichus eleginoides]
MGRSSARPLSEAPEPRVKGSTFILAPVCPSAESCFRLSAYSASPGSGTSFYSSFSSSSLTLFHTHNLKHTQPRSGGISDAAALCLPLKSGARSRPKKLSALRQRAWENIHRYSKTGVMRQSDMDLGHDAPQAAASGPPPQQGVLSSARPLGNQLPMRTTFLFF